MNMHNYLNLLPVASGDIRDSPTSFLFNALFIIARQQIKKARQCLIFDNALSGNQNKKKEKRESANDTGASIKLSSVSLLHYCYYLIQSKLVGTQLNI